MKNWLMRNYSNKYPYKTGSLPSLSPAHYSNATSYKENEKIILFKKKTEQPLIRVLPATLFYNC